MTEDSQLNQIDDRLEEIEVQISKLKELKKRLLKQKEKLADKSNYEKSEALAKNEWNQGINMHL
jgi:predicted nuclease with TOPRIM domain